MPGSAARVVRNAVSRLRARGRRHCVQRQPRDGARLGASGEAVSSAGAVTLVMPALLTSTVGASERTVTSATARGHLGLVGQVGDETERGVHLGLGSVGPRSWMRSVVAVTTTAAPRLPSRRAVAIPMPSGEPAPVTSATLPVRSKTREGFVSAHNMSSSQDGLMAPAPRFSTAPRSTRSAVITVTRSPRATASLTTPTIALSPSRRAWTVVTWRSRPALTPPGLALQDQHDLVVRRVGDEQLLVEAARGTGAVLPPAVGGGADDVGAVDDEDTGHASTVAPRCSASRTAPARSSRVSRIWAAPRSQRSRVAPTQVGAGQPGAAQLGAGEVGSRSGRRP